MKKLKVVEGHGLDFSSTAKKMVLFSVFFLFNFSVFSQGSNNKKPVFSDSIVKYWYTDSTKTKVLIKEYISTSNRNNDSKKLFDAYHAMASFYYQYNDTLKFVEYTDKLFSVAKKNNLKIELLKAYHLKNIAMTMTSGIGDERIFGHIYEALKIAKEIQSTVWERKYYDDLASYYEITGDFEKALNQYKDNLAVLNRIAESPDYKKFKKWGGSIEKTYLELTDIYIDLKQVDSAKTYSKKAKSVLDSTEGNYHDVYRFRNKINELEINLLEDNIDSAKENLSKALKEFPISKKKSFKDYIKLYYSGLISYHEGNYEETIDHFEAIDTAMIQSNERVGLFYDDFYKILYKSYLKTNDLERADFFFEKHIASLKGQMNINNSVNSNFKNLEISQYNEEVRALKKERLKQRLILSMILLIAFVVTVLIIVLFRVKQKRNKEKLELLMERISEQESLVKPKVVPLKINDDEIKRIIKRINELEETGYYLKNDCTLSNLAKKLKTNTTYLSKIFNIHYEKSFNTYINDLRIDFVIERLKHDTLFRRYSIQSLANEVGFKSKESFNAAFKKRTGVLPSALVKKLTKK